VSIHADGADAQGSGFHIIAPARSPDGGNESILAGSTRLADALRTSFAAAGHHRSDYAGHGGLDARADLAGLNLSRVPKVFLECANMRNPDDAARVADPEWRQRAAAGIADGITAYLAG
jgi:N-acetylmuramoyl-L-alanine amidase